MVEISSALPLGAGYVPPRHKRSLLFVEGPAARRGVSDQRFCLHSSSRIYLLTWETGEVIPLPPILERSNKIDLLASHDLISTQILFPVRDRRGNAGVARPCRMGTRSKELWF